MVILVYDMWYSNLHIVRKSKLNQKHEFCTLFDSSTVATTVGENGPAIMLKVEFIGAWVWPIICNGYNN